MKLIFKKSILFALVTALAVAALPFRNVSAVGQKEPSTPPASEISDEKLEQVWARQLRIYERIGKGFDRVDEFTARAQERIDKAKENGKDVTALQAALDAFEAAVKDAYPIYESTKGLVNAHQGFDKNGNVTETEKARETVQALREKLKEIKSTMDGTRKVLREAIKAFREANPRPAPAVTPEG
jgi:hypothetical protein